MKVAEHLSRLGTMTRMWWACTGCSGQTSMLTLPFWMLWILVKLSVGLAVCVSRVLLGTAGC